MLSAMPRLALLALLFVSSCHRITPAEEKLLGTWEWSSIDATGRIEFRRDHTTTTLFYLDGQWEPVTSGKWRLKANDLLTEQRLLPTSRAPNDAPPRTEHARLTIRSVSPNKIVFVNASDMTRVR
jgi:hypothetical protein